MLVPPTPTLKQLVDHIKVNLDIDASLSVPAAISAANEMKIADTSAAVTGSLMDRAQQLIEWIGIPVRAACLYPIAYLPHLISNVYFCCFR